MQDLIPRAREYLIALTQDVDRQTLAAFFTPEVEQLEFPNALNPQGARRDLNALLEGFERGRTVMSSQSYAVHNVIQQDQTVVLEVEWRGTLSVPLGALAPGDELRAFFAVILEFEGERISKQRNYDCFLPWESV